MATRVQKIELTQNLDPHFGNIIPNQTNAYVITVTREVSSFWLILLLPDTETEKETEDLLDDVLHLFLEVGSSYRCRSLTDNDVEDWEEGNTPIISFNPESSDLLEFFWLIPPKNLMN
jgi:hypothetical protein